MQAYDVRISDWSSDVCSSDLVGHRGIDLIVAWVAVAFEQCSGGHQHARRAEAALYRIFSQEGLLQRMVARRRQRLNGCDEAAFHRSDRDGAGAHRLAIGNDRACAAARIVAAIFRACKVRCVAQRPQQRRSEEHTSELQSLMRISYAVFCLTKKTRQLILTQ